MSINDQQWELVGSMYWNLMLPIHFSSLRICKTCLGSHRCNLLALLGWIWALDVISAITFMNEAPKSHHETGVASGFCHLSFTLKSSWKVDEERINQNTVLLESCFQHLNGKKHVMYILYLIHDMSTVIYTIIWPTSIFNWFATKKLQIIQWPQVISTKYPSHQGSCTARRSRRSLILEGLQKDQPAMSGSLCWRWIDTNCLENVCRQRTAGDIFFCHSWAVDAKKEWLKSREFNKHSISVNYPL